MAPTIAPKCDPTLVTGVGSTAGARDGRLAADCGPAAAVKLPRVSSNVDGTRRCMYPRRLTMAKAATDAKGLEVIPSDDDNKPIDDARWRRAGRWRQTAEGETPRVSSNFDGMRRRVSPLRLVTAKASADMNQGRGTVATTAADTKGLSRPVTTTTSPLGGAVLTTTTSLLKLAVQHPTTNRRQAARRRLERPSSYTAEWHPTSWRSRGQVGLPWPTSRWKTTTTTLTTMIRRTMMPWISSGQRRGRPSPYQWHGARRREVSHQHDGAGDGHQATQGVGTWRTRDAYKGHIAQGVTPWKGWQRRGRRQHHCDQEGKGYARRSGRQTKGPPQRRMVLLPQESTGQRPVAGARRKTASTKRTRSTQGVSGAATKHIRYRSASGGMAAEEPPREKSAELMPFVSPKNASPKRGR